MKFDIPDKMIEIGVVTGKDNVKFKDICNLCHTKIFIKKKKPEQN